MALDWHTTDLEYRAPDSNINYNGHGDVATNQPDTTSPEEGPKTIFNMAYWYIEYSPIPPYENYKTCPAY